MAELIHRRWAPRDTGSRRDRQGCDYDAYLPDPLAGWDLMLPAALAADVADAEHAIVSLNRSGTSHVSLEGIARYLLRAESVASSRIEGLQVGARRLVEAEALIAQGQPVSDRVAVEILGNIASMEEAIRATGDPFRLEDLLGIHRTLMADTRLSEFGGVVRDQQNWIGGNALNPCSAAFVPPPPEVLAGLLEDLVTYINGDDHPALVQAAIAHAQFETIHPFIDGNGRAGRALIHVVLRRRGVAPRFVPPVSLVLATRVDHYVSSLTAYRHLHSANSPERSLASHQWLATFADATLRACHDAERYAADTEELSDRWRTKLGRVRAGSTVELLLGMLTGWPLVTVASVVEATGRSNVAVGSAINRLVDAGILVERDANRRRNRTFQAPDALALFTALERTLASPTGDTLVARPNRPVPPR